MEAEEPKLREISRNEIVLLQNGDAENTAIWRQIVKISKAALDKLFAQMGVEVDVTLGETFYHDKMKRI